MREKGPLRGPGSLDTPTAPGFLGLTGLTARGFVSLTGPLAPRVVVAADAADYKKGAASPLDTPAV